MWAVACKNELKDPTQLRLKYASLGVLRKSHLPTQTISTLIANIDATAQQPPIAFCGNIRQQSLVLMFSPKFYD